MDSRQTSIPVRASTSGIPRPTSRLPVLKSSASQSQLRQAPSSEQLRKKPSLSSITKPRDSITSSTLQKKSSRASLRSTTPATAGNAGTNRLSTVPTTSTTRRTSTIPSTTQSRPSTSNGPAFKKPIGRQQSRQSRMPSLSSGFSQSNEHEEDTLGDLNGFRSASRASSRAGFHEQEPEYVLESGEPSPVEEVAPPAPIARKSRPSLSDRTIESLSQLPSSPAGKSRRRSSFFNADNSMPPPMRPASALGGNRRPTTSDGTPQATPATPRRFGGGTQRGSMTAPGKRSVSAAVAPDSVSTPSKAPVSRLSSAFKKQPLAPMQNLQATPKARPLSNSKTMLARTPKARPSLVGAFRESVTPPATVAVPVTPSPKVPKPLTRATPETTRKVSSSSSALREQIAKAKAARLAEPAEPATDTPEKKASSSSALRDQIAKAKEAARRAHAAKQFGNGTPPREVPAVTEHETGIEPDPEEISGFDFGLDDPFNQRDKGSKSLLRKRIDAGRADGRLNIAAMGLSEIPDDVLNMYKYDPSDNSIAWGEIVDLTAIIAADNEIAFLPDKLFPDVDINALEDGDEDGPQFGGVLNLDLHGNTLGELPMGLRRLTQLTKLDLSRNQLSMSAFEVITQIASLRELKLTENGLQGDVPSSLGDLRQLETLHLQGNSLRSLPSEICELVHLRTLNISDNRIASLPSGLFTSVPLIELIASKNAFQGSFLDQVETVPHLQALHLSQNSITALCSNATIVFPALKTLDISLNRLTGLPDISSWTSLTTLLVGENKLTELPDGFVSLSRLRTADFTANNLKTIDEKIAFMESLDNLTLAANPLRERKFLTLSTQEIKNDLLSRVARDDPSAVAANEEGGEEPAPEDQGGLKLGRSGTLDLSSKELSEIDEEGIATFAGSNDIRQVYLQQNHLTSIPSVFAQLAHLTVLDLSKNNFTGAFSEAIEFPKLQELRLPGNKLTSFDGLMQHLAAPSLQILNVSNNRIAGPLPALHTKFPVLRTLLAADNAISEVSAASLEGLKAVNLSNNEISKLEPEIGLHAGTLTNLELEGNKFRVPNYALLRKGTEAVLAWLKDRIPSPTEEFFVTPRSPETF